MYNKKQIEKNLNLFTISLDEIFTKITLNPHDEFLYERAEVTLELAEHVKSSLSIFKDKYIKEVIRIINSYSSVYNAVVRLKKYQKEMLKTPVNVF